MKGERKMAHSMKQLDQEDEWGWWAGLSKWLAWRKQEGTLPPFWFGKDAEVRRTNNNSEGS
jgi:hypothetical protein